MLVQEDDMADEATKRRWAEAAAIFARAEDHANIGVAAPQGPRRHHRETQCIQELVNDTAWHR